jgi:2-ketocyclohexanecarboxyl-CoA hydrolase
MPLSESQMENETSSGHKYLDIIFEVVNGVATITINRPKRLNALTGVTLNELAHALDRTAMDREIGVIVLTGAGDRAFCAGGDVDWESEGGLDGLDYTLGAQIVNHPKPVIARVNGYAIGGGNHLAYICDLTIAAEHSIFGQNGPRLGAPSAGYAVAHAASILGHKRAKEMWMLCRQYSARQALEWGLVNTVVPMAELDTETRRWCDEILSLSPTSLRAVKRSFRQHMNAYLDLKISDVMQEVAPNYFTSGEQQEGVKAFREKRQPDFSQWR